MMATSLNVESAISDPSIPVEVRRFVSQRAGELLDTAAQGIRAEHPIGQARLQNLLEALQMAYQFTPYQRGTVTRAPDVVTTLAGGQTTTAGEQTPTGIDGSGTKAVPRDAAPTLPTPSPRPPTREIATTPSVSWGWLVVVFIGGWVLSKQWSKK